MKTFAELKRLIPFRDLLRRTHPEHFREKGNVCCPFHDDKNPSMQVNDDNGFCFSCGKAFDIFDLWMHSFSCTNHEALEAINLEFAGQYKARYNRPQKEPQRKEQPKAENVDWVKKAEFIYVDEESRPLFRVERLEPVEQLDPEKPKKKFKQSTYDRGQWVPGAKQTRKVLYDLPNVMKAEHVYIVEGEKDVHTLKSHGLTATTNAGGSSAWQGQVEAWGIERPLRGKKVTIIPDNDIPGRKHANAVERTLRGMGVACRQVHLPTLVEAADATDFINAKGIDVFNQVVLDVWAKSPTGLRVQTMQELFDKDLPEPKWVVEDILPEGLCLFAGDPKLGKSWMAFHLLLAVSGCELFMEKWCTNPGRGLYFALEDNERRAKSRLQKLLKHHKKHSINHAEIAYEAKRLNHAGGIDAVGIKDQIIEWYEPRKNDARIVIIDTLEKVRPHGKRQSDNVYSQDYEDLGMLQQLAGELKLAIVVIHHNNKGEHSDPLKKISGSSGVSGSADTIWTLTRNRMSAVGTFGITGRDVEEKKYSVELSPESCIWTCKGESGNLYERTLKDQIYEVLMEVEGHTASASTIAQLTGIKVPKVSVTLNRMQLDTPQLVEKASGRRWRGLKT